ncbi:secreted protein-related [Anaeramoeba flamelloides]|uniref:Secreted protein-related n=1 Tax=Anaeramoeba flamelloides TaxID=1746091 RepID=A0AAV8ACA7_9EUKA|nr:secreted protein-related [Anaeramoeba flamelloides]
MSFFQLSSLGHVLIFFTFFSLFACLTFDRSQYWVDFEEDFSQDDLSETFHVNDEDYVKWCSGCGNSDGGGFSVILESGKWLEKSFSNTNKEFYFEFDFDPNEVTMTTHEVIVPLTIYNEDWSSLMDLFFVQSANNEDAYELRLERSVQGVEISSGYHNVVVGIKLGEWTALWVDSTESSITLASTHEGTKIHAVKLGVNQLWHDEGEGTYYFDNFKAHWPKYLELYVDCENGDDTNDGTSQSEPLKTVQHAVEMITPGGKVLIMDGVCRESVKPIRGGRINENGDLEEIEITTLDSNGDVYLKGSKAYPFAQWTQATAQDLPDVDSSIVDNIWYVDISDMDFEDDEYPIFIIDRRVSDKKQARLFMARWPNWEPETEWKFAENWAVANGGTEVETCDPKTEGSHCDDLNYRYLTDTVNLKSGCDLTDGIFRGLDGFQGHYYFKRKVESHDKSLGRLYLDKDCAHDVNPGLGRFARYYIEGLSCLFDKSGEWWYDSGDTKRLYVWPPNGDPSNDLPNLEISYLENGIDLTGLNYIKVSNIKIENFQSTAVSINNYTGKKSKNITIDSVEASFVDIGFILESSYTGSDLPDDHYTEYITLQNSKIQFTDTRALIVHEWWEDAPSIDNWVHPQLRYNVIDNNEFYYSSFYCNAKCYDNAVGLSFGNANQIKFTNNHVHEVAHNGVQVSKAVYKNNEILNGHVLIEKNILEKACRMSCDCGALKFWGSIPDTHRFNDVLVMKNVFANTMGFSFIAKERGWWTFGSNDGDSEVQGQGGFGLYYDYATGITCYKNVFFNNAFAGFFTNANWIEEKVHFYNNLMVGSATGVYIGGNNIGDSQTSNFFFQNNIFERIEVIPISIGKFEDEDLFWELDIDWFVSSNYAYNDKIGYESLLNCWAFGNVRYHNVIQMQNESHWGDNAIDSGINFVDYGEKYYDRYQFHDIPDFHLSENNPNVIDVANSNFDQDFLDILKSHNKQLSIVGDEIDFGPFEYGAKDDDDNISDNDDSDGGGDDDDDDEDDNNKQSDEDPDINTAGVILGVVFGVLFVACLIFVMVSRKKNGSFSLMWLSWKINLSKNNSPSRNDDIELENN